MVGLERTRRTMSSEGSEDINMNSSGRTQERLKEHERPPLWTLSKRSVDLDESPILWVGTKIDPTE